MSFIDADQGRRSKPIVAVAALHAVIAYGFISGLAYEVIPFVDHPIVARDIPDDPLPPPKIEPRPQPQRRIVKRDVLVAPGTVVERPAFGTTDVIEVPMLGAGEAFQPEPQPIRPLPPAHVSHARGATAIGDRASWVTADDYPPAALRQGIEGTVGIDLTIGADGRVAACEVVATSGDAALDLATCRTYTRRARFTPALDDEGRPVAAHRTERVRWRLPAQ